MSAGEHRHFTGILSIVAEVAGEEAARRLMMARGGTRCYIPARAQDGHWLTELLGREAAEAVCRAIGGGEVVIPLGEAGSLRQHHRRLRQRGMEMLREGAPVHRVAASLRVSERTVWRWRRRWRQGACEELPDLFSAVRDVEEG